MAVEMDETAIRAAVEKWLAEEWRDIEQEHATRSRPYDEHQHDEKLGELADFIGSTREALGTGDMAGAYWAVDAIFEQLGVP